MNSSQEIEITRKTRVHLTFFLLYIPFIPMFSHFLVMGARSTPNSPHIEMVIFATSAIDLLRAKRSYPTFIHLPPLFNTPSKNFFGLLFFSKWQFWTVAYATHIYLCGKAHLSSLCIPTACSRLYSAILGNSAVSVIAFLAMRGRRTLPR